jgi:hypothetical protein
MAKVKVKEKQVIKRIALLMVLLGSVAALAAEPKAALSAFKKMMSLEGEWEGTDADGQKVHSSFKSVISGTTLMETLSPSGMEEMLSLYSVDGDGIQLAHYCPTNNQPRMRAIPDSADPKQLDFQFKDASNLPDISVGHQHRLVIRFEDADHINESWTWRVGNHDMPMVFHLARRP